MRWPYLFYLVIVIAGLLGGCRGQQMFLGGGPEGQFVESYLSIQKLSSETPSDWKAILDDFNKTIPFIRSIDAQHDSGYQKEMEVAIRESMQKRDVEVNKQILLKGLQHVAVIAIRGELNSMLRTVSLDERQDAFGKIAHLVEIVRNRSGDSKKLDQLIKELEKSTQDATIAPLNLITQMNDLLVQSYALGVINEMKQLQSLCSLRKESEQCRVKRKETEFLYRIIQSDVAKNNKSINEAILNGIKKPGEKMTVIAMKERLRSALPLINLD